MNCDPLSGWQLALARQLKNGGESAPPEVLTLVAALRDLGAAAQSTLMGREMRSKRDRESLRDDLRGALEHLGPSLAAYHETGVHDLRSQFGELPDMLCQTTGATVALGHARALLSACTSPESARAAWRDVVEAFESGAHAST